MISNCTASFAAVKVSNSTHPKPANFSSFLPSLCTAHVMPSSGTMRFATSLPSILASVMSLKPSTQFDSFTSFEGVLRVSSTSRSSSSSCLRGRLLPVTFDAGAPLPDAVIVEGRTCVRRWVRLWVCCFVCFSLYYLVHGLKKMSIYGNRREGTRFFRMTNKSCVCLYLEIWVQSVCGLGIVFYPFRERMWPLAVCACHTFSSFSFLSSSFFCACGGK